MSEEKSLDTVNTADTQGKVSDVVVVGNPDQWSLLCKASSKSQKWMKSAKAMEVDSGCIVQVTTQQGDNVAEALVFVPGVGIVPDVNGGKKLVPYLYSTKVQEATRDYKEKQLMEEKSVAKS